MYSLSYYIPPEDHERVKQALFACGAGKIKRYDECCWAVLGDGQFRALEGSQPTLGQVNQLEKRMEYKVEMVCDDQFIRQVVKTLLKEHPYEQPAYFFAR
ncbi:MAG: NGG1p interacting factor NIF3 [gamma proteobacterium symbiont of Bathyaustriella thionipta]|nr:NGG1p interacting factor NIF3 [gamma proteobacterium symbiont of Bathyaustriella thionipta]MCU7948944.1 NGG1p interacting factor NIF3 [gamma proteobacterium symbiont of Bathyaustriella thionipta]MCU7953781.1 NGG1p interacting factor NIF3 [gamma proteobacterium symbiont of Bathyaustriella thionipta]MCU7955455.1 NGG1p interacting factor NIF3 [gamma proteobacterium symbiont of Bathyaustriella thionipta]MCU7966408.1 NGG1p interacting factor NIF3 [gamma proteobacterium symbiont of Bathyaustriella